MMRAIWTIFATLAVCLAFLAFGLVDEDRLMSCLVAEIGGGIVYALLAIAWRPHS